MHFVYLLFLFFNHRRRKKGFHVGDLFSLFVCHWPYSFFFYHCFCRLVLSFYFFCFGVFFFFFAQSFAVYSEQMKKFRFCMNMVIGTREESWVCVCVCILSRPFVKTLYCCSQGLYIHSKTRMFCTKSMWRFSFMMWPNQQSVQHFAVCCKNVLWGCVYRSTTGIVGGGARGGNALGMVDKRIYSHSPVNDVTDDATSNKKKLHPSILHIFIWFFRIIVLSFI